MVSIKRPDELYAGNHCQAVVSQRDDRSICILSKEGIMLDGEGNSVAFCTSVNTIFISEKWDILNEYEI